MGEAGLLDPEDEDPGLEESPTPSRPSGDADSSKEQKPKEKPKEPTIEIPENLTPELLALPGMKDALLRKAGIAAPSDSKTGDKSALALEQPVQLSDNHWLQELDINDYPRE